MPDSNLEKLTKKSLVKMVENSVGSKTFNSFYVLDKKSGEELDILEDGGLSCASFVSGILTIYGLIDCPHATVKSVVASLTEEYGWKETDELQPGNVVLWEEVACSAESNNQHLGFILNENEAVSNSSLNRGISRHHITYGLEVDGSPTRKIIRIFENTKI